MSHTKRCENSKGKVCHCSCKGLLHGIAYDPYRSLSPELVDEKEKKIDQNQVRKIDDY